MLNRLHTLQKEMHEEFLKDEALKAEDQQRHFSMFGSLNKPSTSNFTSPKGVSPRGEKTKTPDNSVEKDQEKNAQKNGDEHLIDGNKVAANGSSVSGKVGGKGVKESQSQTPCSSKDGDSVSVAREIEDSVKTGTILSSTPKRSADGQNGHTNGATVDSDSEDEVRKEDITVEERKARLKRTLSPSYFNDDLYRLKKKRVKRDSFMCKLVALSEHLNLMVAAFCFDK